MKLFKSSIFAVLGLAVALTACSDDKDHPDYTPAGASAGAYFNAASPKAYIVKEDMSSVDVPVYRTKDAGTTFEVAAVDTAGIFTVPTTVTFSGNELTTPITITYDPAKLVDNVRYSLTLSLKEVSGYGQQSCTFTIMKLPELEPVVELGNGTYYYNVIYSDLTPDEGLPTVVTADPENPDHWTVTIQHWGPNMNFEIDIPNVKNVDSEGRTTIFVHPQLCETDPDYGRIYVADYYSYQDEYFRGVLGLEPADKAPEDGSFYTPEKGRFSINIIYFIPDYSEGTSYFTPQTYEYFQLDGYPDYDVDIVYDGLFINKVGDMTANATITAGADAEEVKTVMVKGKDPQAGLDAILSNAKDVQSFETLGSFSVTFPVTDGGDYTIVAATIAEGEIQEVAYDSFQIKLGDDNADWDKLGVGSMIDGWVIAGYQNNDGPLQADQYPFGVTIQQHKVDPTLYRLVTPYGSDFPMNDYNAYPSKRNIEFVLDEGIILIQPQLCGFGAAGWKGEMTIGNRAGSILQQNEGATAAQIKNYMIGKGYELDEYDPEELTATINTPFFGAPGIGDGDFGYSWKVVQPAYIFMPA
ncbi:MAG: hypothetical protein K2K84_03000, partial [Muribaculaceae bacterium]|nr:hypothetical protein [Muribaculaceae bacterium]